MEDKSLTAADDDLVDGTGGDAAVVVEQFQRASVTSVEDLIENRTNRSKNVISDSDIEALNKVLPFFRSFSVRERDSKS